ncbi:hypothetical protein GALMADRAFT_217814 [Galerina marginata CBS 339.88]|uniref:Nucleolar 27S pre-rRNA processing Urb2/Npa2 C-terminal domain-containing protein n=1 Tax=Galerina marginata (strain CBS 339.88) TaxID=685588 RepID=A0A067TR03_GALM3|nr:hypothetical protein GALMADRAFT_217814 [Galerina marginata CBS 339.88]
MSSSAQANILHSSQGVVRALKAASDPPVVGGPSKIQIAQEAWDDPSFYVPSKAEVIADWVLTKLLKDKSKELLINPIFNTHYWQLIISLLEDPPVKHSDSRPTKTWLTSLLHRIPLGPVVVAFLTSFNISEDIQKEELASVVGTCLAMLWPIAVQRMSTEILQECVGALFFAVSSGGTNDGISRIGHMISNSYGNSLANSSNKKKLYHSFLQSHLKSWIQSLERSFPSHFASLKSSILEAGVETIFNLDILRQSNDSKAEHSLVEHLRSFLAEDRDLVLKIIPDLYACYLTAIKKRRGALFSQSSQSQLGGLEELHEAGLRFFVSVYTLMDDSHQDYHAWDTRLLLLQTVERANIVDHKETENHLIFNQIIELVIVALSDGWKEDRLECTSLAVQCLSTIAHIDHDLMLPFISRILPLLLQIPVPSDRHFMFFDILLSYHTKTRSMGTLVQHLLSSITTPTTFPKGPRERYQLFFSSPAMDTFSLDRLSMALQRFLTESQCLPTINLIFDTLKNTWESIYSNLRQLEGESAESPRKKRKTMAIVTANQNPEDLTVTYSLISRLGSVVLSSLPMSSLSSERLTEVRQLLDDFRAGFIYTAISKSIKVVKKNVDTDIWSAEVTVASTLRLLYALDVSGNLSLPPHKDEKTMKKVVELLERDDLLPELTLELYRTLLYSLSRNTSLDHETIIECLLQYLEKKFTPTDVRWSTYTHHLTKGEPGRAEAALATLHMVIERWLPEIDRLASSDQLGRFLKTIMTIDPAPGCHSSQQMQPEQVLIDILHSAQFWEFRNIQSGFLTLLDQMTGSLDTGNAKRPKLSFILDKVSIFRCILFFPMEYFSWQLLNGLIKRCLVADSILTSFLPIENGEVTEGLIMLRVFLKRAYSYCGSVGHDANQESSEFLIHLLKSVPGDADMHAGFRTVTLELVEIYLSKLLKTSKKNGPKLILDVLTALTPGLFSKSMDVPALTFISLVDLLQRDFPPNSLPEELVAAIWTLYDGILASLMPRIHSIAEQMVIKDNFETSAHLVSGWHSLLCLQKWLAPSKTKAQPMPIIGGTLTSKLILSLAHENHSSKALPDGFCVNSFAILLQELDLWPVANHPQQLDIIIVVYISLTAVVGPPVRKDLDLQLSRFCRTLVSSDYSHTLSLISDSLSDIGHLAPDHLLHLVHLASLALRDHPTHSLIHVQKFTTHCINIFNGHSVFVQGPMELRLQVLELVSQQCSDQPAALRSLDAAGIWSLLFKYLAPSKVHDEDTEVNIFHKIISTISSLIRLRQDLVTRALPHLGLVLGQLVLSFRGCRPNLGGKQTALVMATQPRWISPTRPLAAEEAKALGRLLESLNIKTTVRVTTSFSHETQKAESLAKPFSKHAAYVLQAYIEAMNDPLCVLPLELRKELQPGLFALCGMISEHSRDSLMVSALDAGGKTTLKALWKEYDKQRYVGKG